jgi:Tfp pilus assembly protein PilX
MEERKMIGCPMKNSRLKKGSSGQVLTIVLLLMAVLLTVALSVVSRSITDIRISRQEEESARAFSVAEAGIEASLKAGSATPVTIDGISANVTEDPMGNEPVFIFPTDVDARETQTVWLVGHNAQGLPDHNEGYYSGNKITIYWGNETESDGSDKTPALEASLLYQNGVGQFLVKRNAFDPYPVSGTHQRKNNKFWRAGVGVGFYNPGGSTETFRYRADFGIPAGSIPYALRLKLIYNTEFQLLGVESDDPSHPFPLQGKCFKSSGKVLQSGITRTVEQCQFYSSLPGIFDYVLFSEGDLVKDN